MDYWQQQQQRKEGRRFSTATGQALASHTQALREAATAFSNDQAEMNKQLSGLGSAWDIPQNRRAHIAKIANEHRPTVVAHIKALHTRADDLDRLWQDTGQGDPYPTTASRSTGGIEYKAGAGGRSTFNTHLAERKSAAADRHAMKRIARLAPAPQPPTVIRLRGPFVEATEGQVAGAAVKLAALELSLLARRPPWPGRF